MKGKKEGKISKRKGFLLKYGLKIGIILLLFDFFVLFFLRNYSGLSIFADLMSVIISAGVAFIAFSCYHGLSKKFLTEKNFFKFLAIAFVFRFFGEALWAYYDLSAMTMPAFSFADLAWLLSNLIIILGFEYKLHKPFVAHRKRIIWIFGLVISLLSAFFVLGVYLKLLILQPDAWFAYLVNESYVLFDLFILMLIITPLYFSRGQMHKSFLFYLFMTLGFICVVIYDFLFAEMFLKGTYFSGGIIEILYFFSYFLMYCAFYFKYKFLEGRIRK